MFRCIIGLEMRPSRLWAMRPPIFGLGFAQVALAAGLLTLVGLLTGFPPAASFVAGAGFVLTSTAIVMQLLEERGELAADNGQTSAEHTSDVPSRMRLSSAVFCFTKT